MIHFSNTERNNQRRELKHRDSKDALNLIFIWYVFINSKILFFKIIFPSMKGYTYSVLEDTKWSFYTYLRIPL